MIHSLEDARRAEAHFVGARHSVPRADIGLAIEYSEGVINAANKLGLGLRDPLFIADALVEVGQFGLQIEDDDLALQALISASDLADTVCEEKAQSVGWSTGMHQMIKAKARLVADIHAEEPDEDTVAWYRAATARTHEDIVRSLHRNYSQMTDDELILSVGYRTELAVLSMLNQVNRSGKIKALAVHAGQILDICGVFLLDHHNHHNLSSDIEIIGTDIASQRENQTFVQVKRVLPTNLHENKYAKHIVMFVANQVMKEKKLLSGVENLGFLSLEKRKREELRTTIYGFMTHAMNFGRGKRQNNTIGYYDYNSLRIPEVLLRR